MELILLFFDSKIIKDLKLSLIRKSIEFIFVLLNAKTSNFLNLIVFNVFKMLGDCKSAISTRSKFSFNFFRSSSFFISTICISPMSFNSSSISPSF